jgi:hypothetical protein
MSKHDEPPPDRDREEPNTGKATASIPLPFPKHVEERPFTYFLSPTHVGERAG